MTAKQRWFSALILCVALLALPHGAAAEITDPAKDLKHDVEILGLMLRADLSKYPLPAVVFVPEAEFHHTIKRLEADEGVIPMDENIFFDCEVNPDLIQVSTGYAKAIEKFEKPVDPDKYFLVLRFHDLYHWSQCKMAGPDRFWSGPSAVTHEEAYAGALEARFLREQLGMVAALPADYERPKRPDFTPVESLPDKSLAEQAWRLVGDSDDLIQWPTVSGSLIFVSIAQASALIEDMYRFPNYDIPGQHLPNYNLSFRGIMYYYNAVMHRGKYVGFEVFKLGGQDNSARETITAGLWTRLYSWWDQGYVPVVKDGKGLVPDNSVYTGKWVQTYPEK